MTSFYCIYASAQLTSCQLTSPPAANQLTPPTAHAPTAFSRGNIVTSSAFASSLFVRSRLDEIIERELRDLSAREEELGVVVVDTAPTTVNTSTDDLSDATSISSTESDEGFFDKMSRHELEAEH